MGAFSPSTEMPFAVRYGAPTRPRGRAGFILQGALHRQVADLIDEIGFALAPTRLVRDLTAAERQMTEILCALAERPRLLMLDEPTSSLSTLESRAVAAMVERLKARGTGILFISHRLDEVLAICDRVVVLKDGAVTLNSARHSLDRETLIRAMVGRKLTERLLRDGRLGNREISGMTLQDVV